MLSDLEKRIKKSLAIGFTALTFLSPTIIPNFTNRANAASVRGKYDLFIHWKHPEAPSLNLEFIPYAQKNGGAWYPIVLENIHSEIRPDTTFYTGIMRAFDGGNYNFKMKARYKDSGIPSTEFSNIFNKSFAEINLNDVTPPSLTLNPLNYIPEEEKLIISGTINDNQDGYDLFIDGNPIELNKENKETHKWSKTIPYENIVNNQIIVKARDVMWNETVKTIAVSLDNVINNYYYNFLEDAYNTIPVEVDGENFTSLEADPLNSDSNNAKYLAEIQIPIIDPEKDYCIDFESNIEGKDQELEIILSDSSQNKLPLRFRLKEGHHYNMADIKTMVYDASKISEFNYDEISEQIAIRILNVEDLIGFMREDKIYMGKIELREKGEVLSGRMVPTGDSVIENITNTIVDPTLITIDYVLPKDTIAYFDFDDPNHPFKDEVTGIDATPHGGTLVNTSSEVGYWGKKGNYINLKRNPFNTDRLTEFTILTKYTAENEEEWDHRSILQLYNNSNFNELLWFHIQGTKDGPDCTSFRLGIGNGDFRNYQSTAWKPIPGKEHNLALTFENGPIEMFVDDENKVEKTSSIQNINLTNSNIFYLGKDIEGIIDETAIIKRKIKEKELKRLTKRVSSQGNYPLAEIINASFPNLLSYWNFENGFEDNIGNNNGTTNEVKIITGFNGKGCSGLTNDSISYNPFFNSENISEFTISTIYKANNKIEYKHRNLIMNYDPSNFNSLLWVHIQGMVDNKTSFRMGLGNGSSRSYRYISWTPNPGQDYHLITTFKNGIGIFYIDGIKVGEKEYPFSEINLHNATRSYLAKDINGMQDETAIWDRCLSENEVLKLNQIYKHARSYAEIIPSNAVKTDITTKEEVKIEKILENIPENSYLALSFIIPEKAYQIMQGPITIKLNKTETILINDYSQGFNKFNLNFQTNPLNLNSFSLTTPEINIKEKLIKELYLEFKQ